MFIPTPTGTICYDERHQLTGMNEILIDAPYLEGGFQLGIPIDSLLHGEVI
jgi:hypothetical protein